MINAIQSKIILPVGLVKSYLIVGVQWDVFKVRHYQELSFLLIVVKCGNGASVSITLSCVAPPGSLQVVYPCKQLSVLLLHDLYGVFSLPATFLCPTVKHSRLFMVFLFNRLTIQVCKTATLTKKLRHMIHKSCRKNKEVVKKFVTE